MTNEDIKMSEPMSKEEMIDTLKGLVFGTFDRTTAKEREALDMAIKALEQQPCEKCVSIADLLEFLKGIELLHNHDELRSNLIYGIMNLPSVKPKAESEEQETILDKYTREKDIAIKALNQLPFINKPCISEGVCHEDKVNVLEKIRAEIMQVANQEKVHDEKWAIGLRYAVKIIDKYRESEDEKCLKRIISRRVRQKNHLSLHTPSHHGIGMRR